MKEEINWTKIIEECQKTNPKSKFTLEIFPDKTFIFTISKVDNTLKSERGKKE